MKFTIAILSLVLSANVLAYSVPTPTLFVTEATLSTSGLKLLKQAEMVLNDSQEFIQTGNLTAFLGQKIKDTQSLNAGISKEEALDLLISDAESQLK